MDNPEKKPRIIIGEIVNDTPRKKQRGYIDTDGLRIRTINIEQVKQVLRKGEYDKNVVELSADGTCLTFHNADDSKIPQYTISTNGNVTSTNPLLYSVMSVVKNRGLLQGVNIFIQGNRRYVNASEIEKLARYTCFNAKIESGTEGYRVYAKAGTLPEINTDGMSSGAEGTPIVNKGQTDVIKACHMGHLKNSEIEAVQIPSKTKVIPQTSFYGCKKLKRVEIAEGVEIIGKQSFACSGVENLRLPKSMKKIQSEAFKESAIKEIEIGGVQQIGERAFAGTGLRRITWMEQLQDIGSHAFTGTQIKGFKMSERVKRVGESVFANCNELEELEIGQGIQELPANIAYRCPKLKSVRIPKQVKEIGVEAFYQDKELAEVLIEKGSKLEYLGKGAFEGCSKLQKITIPQGMKKIGERVFTGSGITAIEMPEGMEQVAEYCFMDCKALKIAKLPESLTKIGVGIFYGCESLQEVNLPRGITEIPPLTFGNCNIKHITIPAGVQRIGADAFTCSKIESMELPESVESLGSSVFCSCKNLQKLYLPALLLELANYMCCGCTSLQEIKLPEYIESIPTCCFKDCISLMQIEIPQWVQEIESKAFDGCKNLKLIRLPDNISTIEATAFQGVSKRVRIECGEESQTAERMRFLGYTNIKGTAKGI